MSQIGGSYGWFIQLQKQYPTSALVTELVQIHQERFIVKAIVQISGVAIATSMAESASLETAEDQARLRVLDLLGILVVSETSNLGALTAPELLPAPSDRLPEIPLSDPLPLSEPSPAAVKQPADQPLDNGFPLDTPTSLNLDAIAVSAPVPLPEVPLPEVSDFSVPLPEVPLPEVLLPTETIPTEADSNEEAVSDFGEEYLSSAEDYDAGYESSELENTVPEDIFPEDAFPKDAFIEDPFPKDPLIETETAAIAPTESLQKDDFPAPLNLDTPKKAIALEASVVSAPADATEPDDLSTLIAHTDVEMDRIGWTKQEGRDYLKRTYKKSTRQRLDADELMDFLHYLRALPSVNGI